MNNKEKISETPKGGLLRRVWQARRSFRGFGLLLFYCHMLMLFSVLTRIYLADIPEYALLVRAGRVLVPALFTITTLSLFRAYFFWPALVLGCLHLPFAATQLWGGPEAQLPWLLGLGGLLALLAVSLRVKLSG